MTEILPTSKKSYHHSIVNELISRGHPKVSPRRVTEQSSAKTDAAPLPYGKSAKCMLNLLLVEKEQKRVFCGLCPPLRREKNRRFCLEFTNERKKAPPCGVSLGKNLNDEVLVTHYSRIICGLMRARQGERSESPG